MGALSLLNFVLLAFPIGVTIAVLMGLETHRESTGQSPLFRDNGIKTKKYCQKTLGISPPSKGEHFTLNPNQWGWDEGDEGSLCVNVTTFNNETYATDATAPEFSVTWLYPPGPESEPVHAFPNCKIDSGVFPSAFQDIEKLDLDLAWTYSVGNSTSVSTDEKDMKKHLVNTNVAIDIFADSDKKKAEDTEKAGIEIMVWFAAYGPATQPIGLAEGAVKTKTVDGDEFSLYTGENASGQKVFTWYSDKPIHAFKGDIMPLIEELFKTKGTGYPKKDDYLGYLSLGSEALSANKTVTFHVPKLSVDVKTS